LLKKPYLLIFTIALLLGIGNSVYKHFKDPLPLFRDEINLKKDISISKYFDFKKNGCYEVGLWSDSNLFDGRGVLNTYKPGATYPITGKYTLSYYNGDELIDKQVIKSEDLSSVSMDGSSKASKLAFDRLEIPYKGKYSALTIKFEIQSPKDKFKNTNENIYFFIDKTLLSCGEKIDRIIRKRKFNIDIAEINSTLVPLYNSLRTKDKQSVERLIDSGISKKVKMIGERRPIHYASFMNDDETLKYLISKNVDLNVKDVLGKTPLHYGIENNATKTVKTLLENGADLSLVTEVDNYLKIKALGKTPLVTMYVSFASLYEMLELLLENGLNPNYCIEANYMTLLDNLLGEVNVNKNSLTPRTNRVEEMIVLIKKYGAKKQLELKGTQYKNIIR